MNYKLIILVYLLGKRSFLHPIHRDEKKKEMSEREIIHHLNRQLLLLFKSDKMKIGPFLNKPSFYRRDMRYDSNIPLAGSLVEAMRLVLIGRG